MATTTALPAESTSSIPVIDLGAFNSGCASTKRRVAAEVDAALRSDGFLYLTNHGIDAAEISACFKQSKAYFDLPYAVKALHLATSSEPYGFSPVQHENVRGQAAQKESFSFRTSGDGQRCASWPPEHAIPGFRPLMLQLFNDCAGVISQLLDCLSLALSLPAEHHFSRHHTHASHGLGLLHYPSATLTDGAPRPAIRIPAHADFGTLTLLFQDAVGGLEIADGDGAYKPVAPMAGAIVVNVGYLLMRWTNRRWRSTQHRVSEPQDMQGDELPERFSIAFFSHPDSDVLIEALPGCWDEEHPKAFKAINTGQYLRKKMEDSYGS